MKKIFLTALLSTSLLTLGIHADPIRYGVTGGINYFNLKADSEVADPDFGFTVGGQRLGN